MMRFAASHRRAVLATVAALSGLVALAGSPSFAAGGDQLDDRTSYVLMREGSRTTSMSGSTEDLRRARALRAGGEGLLYVRFDGAAYAIRDAATLRQAAAIFEPQERLGAQQAQLGSRQAALGSRQAALGAEQARIGRMQAEASPRRAAELGREQAELGRQQGELGRQQNALGSEQAALGREQSRLAREARPQFRALVAEAIQRGVAQRVD